VESTDGLIYDDHARTIRAEVFEAFAAAGSLTKKS
jgi:hypothetical protein